MSNEAEARVINEADIKGLADDELLPDRLITVGQVREWRKIYPHSRFLYFEHFEEPYVVRSYQYGDLETYHQLLSKVHDELVEKEKAAYIKVTPNATEEQIEALATSIVLPIKDQNVPFVEMVCLYPTDVVDKFKANTIDAGIPQTIIDVAHKSSGYAQIDVDIITDEI